MISSMTWGHGLPTCIFEPPTLKRKAQIIATHLLSGYRLGFGASLDNLTYVTTRVVFKEKSKLLVSPIVATLCIYFQF